MASAGSHARFPGSCRAAAAGESEDESRRRPGRPRSASHGALASLPDRLLDDGLRRCSSGITSQAAAYSTKSAAAQEDGAQRRHAVHDRADAEVPRETGRDAPCDDAAFGWADELPLRLSAGMASVGSAAVMSGSFQDSLSIIYDSVRSRVTRHHPASP